MIEVMLKQSKICFIGSGAMATAILAGLAKKQRIDPKNVVASDPYPTQLEKLAGQFEVNTTQNNIEAIRDRDVIILAVKPQMFHKVSTELRGQLPTEALVLSIMAGVTIAKMSQLLGHERIVRVMPNTPAIVGKGMSIWTNTEAVSAGQKEQTQLILSALGEEIYVEKENFLDMAAALSGSAPAYIFLFMEAMIDAGVHLGFSRPMAEQIVYQNIEGAVSFARDSGQHPAQLRNMVTSPDGTTAAALYELEKGGFRTVVSKAILAAYKKSRYLGGLDNDG